MARYQVLFTITIHLQDNALNLTQLLRIAAGFARFCQSEENPLFSMEKTVPSKSIFLPAKILFASKNILFAGKNTFNQKIIKQGFCCKNMFLAAK